MKKSEAPETDADNVNRLRYETAMHAVQSAIALDIELHGANAAGADAKHLRTGINSALVDSWGLASLLIDKGVFTKGEYLASMAAAAERERDAVTERMRRKTGNTNMSFG